MGFEGKSKELRGDILKASEGDPEAKKRLSAMGKKGAETRTINKYYRETLKDVTEQVVWDNFYTSELDRLKNTYPEMDEEGNTVDEEWHQEKAIEFADSMTKLKFKLKGK